MRLGVCELHLDFFTLIARPLIFGRSHQCTCVVAGIFVDVARDDALWRVRAALGFEGAWAAVASARRVAQHVT